MKVECEPVVLADINLIYDPTAGSCYQMLYSKFGPVLTDSFFLYKILRAPEC